MLERDGAVVNPQQAALVAVVPDGHTRHGVALLVADGGVEAALALAAADGVPEGDVVAQQHGEFFLVGGGQFLTEQVGHHRPEAVLGMGVVLLRFERLDAGHGAEDQRAAVFINVGP